MTESEQGQESAPVHFLEQVPESDQVSVRVSDSVLESDWATAMEPDSVANKP
jgi:hypothetical protein